MTGAVLGKGMLNVPAVLRCAVGAPNLRSIILEMTVKRDETAPVDAVIHQEQAAVVESRDYLVQELPKLLPFVAVYDRRPVFFLFEQAGCRAL